jgi:hypothetical protein
MFPFQKKPPHCYDFLNKGSGPFDLSLRGIEASAQDNFTTEAFVSVNDKEAFSLARISV